MRGVLIDWLIEVHSQFKLLQETLFMTVYVIDKFLQVIPRPGFMVLFLDHFIQDRGIFRQTEQAPAGRRHGHVYLQQG